VELTINHGIILVQSDLNNAAKLLEDIENLPLSDVSWKVANKDRALVNFVSIEVGPMGRVRLIETSTSWRSHIGHALHLELIVIAKCLEKGSALRHTPYSLREIGTYLMSSLTLIVHLELNHDTLIEVVGGAFNLIDISAERDSAKVSK
jgi:hypothetical protein